MAQKISQLPNGSLVKETDTKYYNSVIIWKKLEDGHDGATNTTLLGNSIVGLKCYDAKEPNNSDSNRKQYGNNRWKVSNIRQWLNSDAAQGAWYTAQHAADQAPNSANVWQQNSTGINPYDTEAGFMNGFSADFKALLQDVTKTTALNTVTDGGGSETTTDKIFLLSETEVGLGNENNIAEGTVYALFTDNASRVAKCTAECISHSNYGSNPTVNDGWYWWLRTPSASHSYYARFVYTDGSLSTHAACSGYHGVRPACSIPSDTLVSDAPDADGAYTIVYNQPPTVSPSSKDYGTVNVPFSDTFTIEDADGDAFTGTVSLDGTQIQTFSGTASYELTVNLLSQWSSLSLSSHTLTITVTDAAVNVTTETYTFTKTAPAVYISGEDADLGRLYEVPTITYSITESEDPVAWIKEHIDGVVTNTIVGPTVGQDYTFDLSGWDNLANGNHTLLILAQNVNGGQGTRTYQLTKLYNHLAFRTEKYETDLAAQSVLLNLTYVGAGITVEVCNNCYDDSPTWEDMTTEALAHRSYEFVNDTKTAAKWGIQFRITITKSESIKDVQCSALSYAYR
jgi:hypothetical protein